MGCRKVYQNRNGGNYRRVLKTVMGMTVMILTVLSIMIMSNNQAKAGNSIDSNTVISVEQAGSIAGHVGDYGWDSRGAYFTYYDSKGRLSGNLGLILFCDESMTPRDRMWDKWGNRFPDWWGRMLAEKIRNSVNIFKLREVREAFANTVTFECKWVIAIGIKDNSIGSGPYLTLRTDDTLRAAYNVDTSKLNPPEKLFSGSEMANSLEKVLPGAKWGTTSQHVFRERNPYIYKVRINSYDINLRATDCIKCAKKGRYDGDYCEHNKKELMLLHIPIKYRNAIYGGEASFVWEGQDVSYDEPVIPGYIRIPASDDTGKLYGTMKDGKISNIYADSTVYFAYRSDSQTGTPDPEPSADPDGPASPTPTSGPSYPGPTSGPGDVTLTPTPVLYDPIPDEYSFASYTDNRLEAMDTMGKAVILSDFFDVRTAIPSTESVYIRASARNYLYSINARTVSGKVPVEVTVAAPYILKWRDDSGNEYEESGISETRTVVYRDYSYVHLDSLKTYVLDGIVISNQALRPSVNELKPGQVHTTLPTFSSPVVYGSDIPAFGGNIDYPVGFSSFILSDETIITDGGNSKPAIPVISEEQAYWTAQNRTGRLRCRNDEFFVNSQSVFGDRGWHEYGTGSLTIRMPQPEITEFDTKSILGADSITIPAWVRNGTYSSSTRLVRYMLAASYGNSGAPYDAMIEVNPVAVHTPVCCKLMIGEKDSSDPNRAYFQENLRRPDDAFVIVFGRSNSPGAEGCEHKTEDFVITIGNLGYHSVYASRLSGTYDYAHKRNRMNGGTYIEGNYLKFPFDVYLDVGNDGNESNDRLIRKNEWVRFSGTGTFYPGETVEEGYYTIGAMTKAVNSATGDTPGQSTPRNANNSPDDYIAVDSVRVYVTGKIYGLTLYEIT